MYSIVMNKQCYKLLEHTRFCAGLMMGWSRGDKSEGRMMRAEDEELSIVSY